MKRRILLICLLLVILSILSVGTYAYYQTERISRNVITSGGLSIELLETGSENHTKQQAVVIMPGDVVKKEIRVKNISGHPMFVRVELLSSVVDSDLDAKKCILPDINTADWQEKNGYYYYKNELLPGETTSELFSKVTFVGEAVTNEYLGQMFRLDANAVAVQSENNGTEPTEALGWPED